MNEQFILPALLVTVILWEIAFPAQRGVNVISSRRFGNLALFPISMIISALMRPQLLALLPILYFDFGSGLLSPLAGHPVLYWMFAFLLLDLSMYLQHRLLHTSGFLWSMHALHHSDTAVDFTTYFRHHPFETLISAVMTFLIAAFFGVTAAMLAFYLLINNAMQLFQHSNVRLPKRLEWIETIFVTPSFHIEHHRIEREIADTNYSTVFTLWDMLFGTYRKGERKGTRFGIPGFEDESSQSVGVMLAMPLTILRKKR
jgi:sterol desaturase/sphingolipid hydroxylase (fatty acid hydroxylase superfamily)